MSLCGARRKGRTERKREEKKKSQLLVEGVMPFATNGLRAESKEQKNDQVEIILKSIESFLFGRD